MGPFFAALAVATSPRFTAMANMFIVVLWAICAILLVVILGYHMYVDVRARRKSALKMKILEAVNEELQANPDEKSGRVVIENKKELFTRRGLAAVSEVFNGLDEAGRTALRKILLRMGAGGFLATQLKVDNEDYLVEIVRLVGDMDLVGLDTRITALLYSHKNNVDLQYQTFLALSRLGSYEPLVRVCMDENYVHTLSFRSLQQILVAFSGDRAKLYEALMNAPDHYIVRICLKQIGLEHMEHLAPEVYLRLESDDYNLIIDAVRTLGQLKYAPAADVIARLLGHARWEVRSIAATALADIDVETYEDALIKALQDSEWQVRYNAGAALGRSPHTVRIREKVLQSNDKYALEMLDYMMKTQEMWRRAE